MSRAVSLSALIAVVGCGAAFSSTAVRPTSEPADVAYACATEQMKAMGYDIASHNDREWRVTAERENPLVRRAEPTFRKSVDRLVAEIEPAGGTGGASLTVHAHTLLEYFNRRGLTHEEVQASEQVRESAQMLLDRCADGAAPDAS